MRSSDLQDHAAERERGTAAGCNHRPAQPVVPDDTLVDRLDGMPGLPETVRHGLRHDVERNCGLANRRTHTERGDKQNERRKRGARAKQEGSLRRHFARPAFSMASARTSIPSIVRIVGFIAWASMSTT